MEDINIYRTLLRNRIAYKTHALEFGEIFSIILILFMLGLILIGLRYPKDILWVIEIVMVSIIFISFKYYKNELCRELIDVETGLTKDKNKQFINVLLKKKLYIVKYYDEDYVRSFSSPNLFLRRRELTIIFRDNHILINLVNTNFRRRWPALKELTRFLFEVKNAINAGT